MKTRLFCSPGSFTATIFSRSRWFTGIIVGSAVLTTGSTFAGTWAGGTSTDWNTNSNWTGGAGGVAQINSIPTNVATITANLVTVPTSIIVGSASAGRVNHVSGNASVLASNDLVLGRTTGGNGTYNLANTGGTGGTFTGYGQGSGSLTIPDQVFVGGSIGASTGTLNIHTSGTLSVGTELLVGNLGGTGTVKMDSGTLTVTNALEIGNGPNSIGTFSMSGGTVTKSSAGSAVTIGGGLTADGGTGTANLNGGTFTAAGGFRVGQNTTAGTATPPHSSGILNLGGTALTVNGEFQIGNNTGASGVMNFTSGTLTTNNWTSIGRKDDANPGTGASGSVNMSGGTWIKNGETNFIVGDTGTGTMVMTGGLVVVNPHATPDRGITWIGNRNNATGTLTLEQNAEFRSPRIVLAVQTETIGTLNLNGGTLKTKGIYGGIGTSSVHFNGGKIVPMENSEDFINLLVSATVETGGLVVDTAGFNVATTQMLDGAGGVTKSGAGTLSLAGSNSYTGNHTVNEGKLFVSTSHAGNGTFTVANGAGMGVIQYYETATMSTPGVTFGTDGGSSLDIRLSESSINPTEPALHVATLRLNGLVTVNVADSLPAKGTFPLISYDTKTGPGGFVLGRLPLGAHGSLTDDGAGTVSLTIDDISFPVWDGTFTANWDTSPTQNWKELTTSAAMKYTDGDPVTFDDSATGSTSVVLDATVSPGEVKFNNETKSYTLGGNGKITGPTGLSKMSAGSLLITTVNEYTGVTTLGGGTTTVNSITNGGVASPLGKATAAAGNLVISGGILNYTGATATSDRGFTTAGPDGGISVPTGVNLTLAGPVAASSGGSSLDKRGEGTLTLTNPSVSFGDLGQGNEVLAGTLAFAGPGQAASVGGDLFVGSAPNIPGHLSVQDSNLTVTGVLAVGRGNGDAAVSTLTATNSVVLVENLSAGFDNALPTNNSDQTITLNNTNWTTNQTTLLAESRDSKTDMVLSGNSVYTGKSNIRIALNNSAEANITIQDTARLVHTGGFFSIGNDGFVTMTVKNSGSLSAVGDFNVSDIGTSTGFLNIQDNATVSTTGVVFVGKNAGTTGTVNITGGTFNSTTYITIGRRDGATGYFNISGGTVNQTDPGAGFIVGENGTGTLTITGGTLNINGGGLYLGAEGATTSVSKAYLNGGTIIAKKVGERDFANNNHTEFHFNGGILRAQIGAATDFMYDNTLVSVDAGGAFIDTNNQNITISQVLVGGGSLTKQGAGVLTLSGTNTYSGNTTVSSGTLTLTKAYLSNSGSVTIATGAVLNLTHGQVDQVAGLTIGGTPLAAGTYDSVSHPGVITGTGKLQVTGSTASAYDSWIAGFPSIPAADRDPGDDPDRDGSSNILEFALGAVPNSGSQRPQVYHIEADGSVDVGTNKELLMTIAVRSGTPAFSTGTSPTAAKDGITYTVQGSTDLAGFAVGVTSVNIVAPVGKPNPPSGYEYRTFSLNGSDTLPNKGFLRVKVE